MGQLPIRNGQRFFCWLVCSECYFMVINKIIFSKKWKKLLTFPHILECLHLATTLKVN